MPKRKARNRKQRRSRLRRMSKAVAAQEKVVVPLATPNHKAPSQADWAGPHELIGTYIRDQTKKTLAAYHSQPNLVAEHGNHEEDTVRGGYAHRQLFELVQNGADALAGSSGGRIWIRLTQTHLYCADDGRAIDPDGLKALMFSHLSPKRGTVEIGRFGLGFKSVLGVTDAPEFFSRSGSFRFNRERAAGQIRPIAPDAERYPVLRLPEAIDPWPDMEADPTLRAMMGWAVNIVRLPLQLGAPEVLDRQMREFPPEFLLFVDHVSQLIMRSDDQELTRTLGLHRENSHHILDDGGNKTLWMLLSDKHELSTDAKNDSRSLDDATEIPISWAVPIYRLNEPGRFWAFFPTMTTSLLSGILNAPWKTNEDRQNLLPGVYNDELIDAAAAMVAKALTRLSTVDDPARHLDALPRREESGDSEPSNRLRNQLHSNLQGCQLVPDQEGELRRLTELSCPPSELTVDGQSVSASFKRWAAYENRPSSWLHHSALNRNRLATLDRLHGHSAPLSLSSLPRVTIAKWLEALVEDANSQPKLALQVDASMAAVQTASLIPESIRMNNALGNIVLTADGSWVQPDPNAVFLGGGHAFGAGNLVHPQLEADPETLDALRKLGIKPVSPETIFREVAAGLLATRTRWQSPRSRLASSGDDWVRFWQLARDVDPSAAAKIIQESNGNWRGSLRVRTIAGQWHTLHQTLLPGRIVPVDGSRDGHAALDDRFHEADLRLLRQLGAVDSPSCRHDLSPTHLSEFREFCREAFSKRDLPRDPRRDMLNFPATTTSGPLDVRTSEPVGRGVALR